MTTLHRVLCLLLLLLAACAPEDAAKVRLRYRSERYIYLAELRTAEIRVLRSNPLVGHKQLKPAWRNVVTLYTRALAALDLKRIETEANDARERKLASLTLRALLGHAAALAQAGDEAAARAAYRKVLKRAVPYERSRGRAALGLAEVSDQAGEWPRAFEAYQAWLEGVERGDWPLHPRGVDVPGYVSRRLADRAEHRDRRAWVKSASRALETAAARGEQPRDARYARFLLLLDAEYWDAAYAALRQTQRTYDPDGKDGGLKLAEASLLATALENPTQALGLLVGLYSDEAGLNVEYRVAASLLSGQIELRQRRLEAAGAHYERALAEARSSMGRAEATLGLARVHAARGEADLARRRYAQLREAYSATPAGLLAPLEEYRLLREQGFDLEAEGVLSKAMHDYRRVITNFGTELPALRAAGYMSEVFGLGGSWERGVAFLDSVSEVFASDPRAGSLLVRAARLAADRLDDAEQARELLARVRKRYPHSDLAVAVRSLEDSLSAR